MDLLESTILRTLGSGAWGQASDLLDRLQEAHAGPGVAAIAARKLMDEGDLAGAERMLEAVDALSSSAEVRSAVRQTQLALGWRTDNGELILESVSGLLSDPETPAVIRDIAQIFQDANPDSESPKTLRTLAVRLARMAAHQEENGLDFFSAVSLHNASVAYLAAADFAACIETGQRALAAFSRLQFQPDEALSTHSIIAVALMEAGRIDEARVHVSSAMADRREFADVPASIAVAYFSLGLKDDAVKLVDRAQALERQGRSDVAGIEITEIAEAFSRLSTNPAAAVELLIEPRPRVSLDLGHALERQLMLAHAYLATGNEASAAQIARPALSEARARGARRAEVRLALTAALAEVRPDLVAVAVRDMAGSGTLALAEFADLLCERLEFASGCMDEVGEAISRHPQRWLPALRRALGRGAPDGDKAAYLIDRFGEAQDVGVLRAYARAYRGRGAPQNLGVALARRASPKLRIHDLGRVIVEVGARSVAVGGMRRKPAALLVYLVTRPAFTAHREQVIDELWPDADPTSALNSLNQSLYFLRREIDPWYEDGVSPEYVGFQGDLLWLDPQLVTADSTEFVAMVALSRRATTGAPIHEIIRAYTGHFAPEFEYDEWALAHRSKLKSTFLEAVSRSISALFREGDLEEARNVAIAALDVDGTAVDIERALIWLHWHLGAESAARAQYDHLARADQRDGLVAPPFRSLIEGRSPIGRE
jgi:DNA-binding SARP family transcriptional activator